MLRKIIRVVAWGAVVAVGVLTLVPIEWRPHTGAPGHLEQAAAYAVAATLFSLAYPRRSLIVIIALFLIYAAGLELAQLYVPSRHAYVSDWTAKSFGALVGGVFGTLILRVWLRALGANEKKAVTGP